MFFFLIIQRPLRSTRTDTLLPYTTLCRSLLIGLALLAGCASNGDRPATYLVQRGDTLYSIAFRHKLDYKDVARWNRRSEEHTSELQSLMRISYAVFCLKTTKNKCQLLNKHLTLTRMHTTPIAKRQVQ